MTMRRDERMIRYTHKPTGTTAEVDGAIAHRRQSWIPVAAAMCRRLLLAKLCRPDEPPRPVRTYDLCPPLGIPPMIRYGREWVVEGREAVEGFLNGGCDLPIIDNP